MDERTIFLNALDLPSPESRAAYLDKICAGDAGLRERVERLLKAHEQQYGLVDRLAGNVDEPTSSMVPADQNRSEPNDDPDDLSFLGPCPSPDCIGSLGSYEILEVLGRGGMGVVLKARDPKLQRIVAIKVLAPEIAANKMAKKRFEREAQATAAVSHDHIVTIYAVDEVKSLPFIVMECIVGRTLQKKIEETGPLELKEILRIGMQAAMGLAAAHKQGLVHRDIKPANILLQNGIQRVKITDFGLARATDDVGMTQTGQIAGTPLYMSPEQAQGQKVDHTSDLFSLGSVLYTMATGRPAFRAPSTIAVLRRVVDDTPRPIHEVNEELPSWLGDIISKLMSKKKEDRFQTAAELAELLSRRLARLQEPRSSTSNNSVVAPPEKPKADPGRKSAVSSKVTSASRPPAAPREQDEHLELPERRRRVKPVRKQTIWDRIRGASPLTWLVAGILVPGMIALVVMVTMLLNRDQLLVRIELDESLRQQDVTLVIDGTTYAARDLGPSIPMKPGPHTLEVKRGNEQFKSEQFTIFQNEKPLFRVKTEGGKLSVERADPGKEVHILAGVHSSSLMQTSWHGWPADAPAPAIAPFNADQAKKHQEEWAAYLKVPVGWRNSINMKFILIPPGEFTMGSTLEEIADALKDALKDPGNGAQLQAFIQSEAPEHKVILTQPFYLGISQVTQAEYEKVMGINPSHYSANGLGKDTVVGLDTGNHPVDSVDWNAASEFCAKLSTLEKLKPFYFRTSDITTSLEGTGYRLPSEAEWEFACRAGSATKYWIGDKDEDLMRAGWFGGISGGRTHAVGELTANPFGVHDMHGNVWQWVQDKWDAAFYGQLCGQTCDQSKQPVLRWFPACDPGRQLL